MQLSNWVLFIYLLFYQVQDSSLTVERNSPHLQLSLKTLIPFRPISTSSLSYSITTLLCYIHKACFIYKWMYLIFSRIPICKSNVLQQIVNNYLSGIPALWILLTHSFCLIVLDKNSGVNALLITPSSLCFPFYDSKLIILLWSTYT